jgi:hypothetical protein
MMKKYSMKMVGMSEWKAERRSMCILGIYYVVRLFGYLFGCVLSSNFVVGIDSIEAS